ncbi:hypothetical protein ACLKA7_012220 [Drosophila subpalustris]
MREFLCCFLATLTERDANSPQQTATPALAVSPREAETYTEKETKTEGAVGPNRPKAEPEEMLISFGYLSRGSKLSIHEFSVDIKD